MANELGHMSAEIGLDIQPFLTNQAVLRTQIRRTGQLLRTMQTASKMSGGAGQGSIFRTQMAQLKMYGRQVENFSKQMARARHDLASHNTVDTQRGLAASATQLQNASLKYDTLRMTAARTYQQMRMQNSWWGQQAAKIGDYGDRLQQVAGKIRGFGSGLASAAIGGAFFNATKSAMAFKSQIQAIGPLLSNDGRITATVSTQLRAMSADSLKWSQQYGISTRSINSAMTELVRRGFTAKQTLGSMPAMLNASRASGESLGTVMQATASAVEMFGLKSNTTAGQVRNTSRVVDVLTMAANKTAASFADISAAMMYVGPTAAQAHMSIEQVAAAIGALSNRGIEASTAGTTLRQVLSKLTTDTATNRAHMKAIGVDIDQIKKKGVDLPRLIDQINSKLQNKTPTEKMALLNQAFGKLGQGVMALFTKTNSSSKSAGSELRDLENQLEHAGGTTKRIAKEMNNTPQAKWQRFKQTIHALGITVGAELLPMFKQAMDVVKGLAKRFDDLSPGTKHAVTNILLLVAALKPLSSIVAAPIAGLGKLMNVMKSVMNFGARMSGGSLASALKVVDSAAASTGGITQYVTKLRNVTTHSRTAASSTSSFSNKLLSTGSKAVSTGSSVKSLASGLTKTGSSAVEAGTGAASFATALSGLAAAFPAVLAVLATAGLAMLAWKNYIKPGVQGLSQYSHEMSVWGTTVGKFASDTGEKFKNFSDKANDSMRAASEGIKGSAQGISSAFKDMGDEASKAVQKQSSKLKELAHTLGGTAGAYINQVRQANIKHDKRYLNAISQDEKQAQQIIKASASNGKKMTADTRTVLNNLQSDITDNFLKITASSKHSANAMRAAINGTFTGHWSRRALLSTQDSLKNAMMDDQTLEAHNLGILKKSWEQGYISFSQYESAKNKVREDSATKQTKLAEGFVRAGRKQGQSYNSIKDQLQSLGKAYGLTGKEINDAIANVQKGDQNLSSTVSSLKGLSGNAKKATKAWNDMIFDPKTGKIKTNAKKALVDMAKTDTGWKKIKFMVKHARMTVKGKELMIGAIIQAGKWNSLTFKEKRALVVTKQDGKLMDTMNKMHQWNNLSPKIQHLIVKAKNPQELFTALHHVEEWNLLTPKQQQLILTGSGFNRGQVLDLALTGISKWNNLTPQQKQFVADYAKKHGGLEAALKHIHIWNSIPKNLRKNIEAVDHTKSVFADIDRKSKKTRKVHVDAEWAGIAGTGTGKASKHPLSGFSNWLKQTFGGSKSKVNVSVGVAGTGVAKSKISSVNDKLKKVKGKHSASLSVHTSGTSKAKAGANAVKSFSRAKSSTKHNTIHTTGASSATKGAAAQRKFNSTPSVHKRNSLHTSGISQVNSASSAQRRFRGISSSHKRNSLHTSGTSQVNSASSAQRRFMSLSGHHITNTIETVHLTTYKKRKRANGTAGAWQFKHFAYGTPNTGFEGGPVIVGDGGRNEVVYEPQSRMLFTTPATDTLMDLEKGSTIWRSVEAFEQAMRFAGIKNYPKFGNGNALSSMVDVSAKLPEDFTSELRDVNNQETRQANKAAKETRDLQMQNNELIAMLVQQNQQMMSFLSRIGFNFNVNGKEFAQATAQDNSKAISHYIKQSGMRFT